MTQAVQAPRLLRQSSLGVYVARASSIESKNKKLALSKQITRVPGM